jgi:NAD(P)-dependent dehydrogenase (short-subunit alcohol dehydrogenase family)
MTDMHGKTVLVTGANTGIGWETAAALAEMGASVVLTARDAAKGEGAVAAIRERLAQADVHAGIVDFSRLDDIRRFAAEFDRRHNELHVLVNNAGAMLSEHSTTPDGLETTFQVNHLGPFLLTNLLLDKLKASAPARIVNVASTAHRGGSLDLDDLQSERGYNGMRVYGTSKLCNILFTRELANRLEGTGVTANSLHPGTVRTGFGQDGDARGFIKFGLGVIRPFILSPAKGARTQIHLASSPQVEGKTGMYWARSRPSRPTKAAQDDEAARRLWEVSENLVGL